MNMLCSYFVIFVFLALIDDILGSESTRNLNLPSRKVSLIDEPDCQEDLKELCNGKLRTNRGNFAVLECVQNLLKDSSSLNPKCHHLIWNYKVNLTKDGHVEELAKDVCGKELTSFPSCTSESGPGHIATCLAENLDQIKDERCHQYAVRLSAIVFSDYRLVGDMIIDCSSDVKKFECGRLQSLQDESPHSQGSTIKCLMTHSKKLSPKCFKEVLRLAEIQSDDFRLDRSLYFACREAREKFCHDVRAGEGRVYKCLMRHKNDRGMNTECIEHLRLRQSLISEDYQVSMTLVKACKTSISKYGCRRGVDRSNQQVKLSQILLCLEGELRKGNEVDEACQGEMLNHRQMLMEDFQISPDLVVSCHSEVETFCSGRMNSKTLHCLLNSARKARKKQKFSHICMRALEDLIKEADAGEDWRADPVLYEACHSYVDLKCSNLHAGQARVLHCLMDHLNSPDLPASCEAALLEIQYFVARDWKLDPQLYRACLNASVNICNADPSWLNSDTTPDHAVLVLPCLFRYIYHPDPKLRLNSECMEEVRRILHERASYVDLHPQIEMNCMGDLAQLCSTHTGPGEEILCLQENLESLSNNCRGVVHNYTEAEANDVGLNSLLVIHCAQAIQEMCSETEKESADDAVMQCLIQHRNTAPMKEYPKCRAVVESFQLISMKHISFSPKFRKECEKDLAKNCHGAKTKADTIECLSVLVRDSVLSDTKHRISHGCRQQLRLQLLQRHENIKLDPQLKKVCSSELQRLCGSYSNEAGMMLECLRQHSPELSKECHWAVFQRKREEMVDPGTDVVLLHTCREMIKTYCHDADFADLLSCLKAKHNEHDFSPLCHDLVVQRMIEQSEDYRLNPLLWKACNSDISQFCSGKSTSQNATELSGIIIECLKEQLPHRTLSDACSTQVLVVFRDAALNYHMDPIMSHLCKNEIRILCGEAPSEDEENGRVVECLKLELHKNNIKDHLCKEHVAKVVQMQRVDIFVDPHLHAACSVDEAKFCSTREKGTHLACLFDILERKSDALQRLCREELQLRRDMYSSAVKVAQLESLPELVHRVSQSPERNYFLVVFILLVGCFFIGGLFCGRASRRYKLLKDR